MAELWEQTVGAPARKQPVLPPSASRAVNDEPSPARVTINLPGGKAPAAPEGPYEPTWESVAEHYRVPEWFMDAKFGIFMHWGVYTVPAAGSEWYPKHMYNGMLKHHTEKWGHPKDFGYKDFIPLFKAEKFDPAAWAALFEQAGARYAILTAEHHDGFAMYDSDLTEWDAVDKGPHRDLLGDLARAVRERGMKFGISNHRIENWDFMYPAGTKEHDLFDPDYAGLYGPPQKPSSVGSAMGAGKDANGNPAHPQSDAFLEEWLARAEEIVDKYQPALYYFDNGVNSRSLDPWKLRFAQYYYNSAARWGKAVSIQTKSDAYLAGSIKDYERESRAPKEIETPYWQVDDPIGHKFGYVEGLQLQKSENVIHSLVENISKGGNLCLNISPKADGTIPDDQQAVLRAVGAWLRIFCEEMIRRNLNTKVRIDCNMRFGRLTLDDYKLMRKAGFQFVLFGVESANQETLDRFCKCLKVEDVEKGAKWATEAGLDVHLTFMFGHAGKKLLFMGQEFGQEREWSEARELDWYLLEKPLNSGTKKYMEELLKIYRKYPCMYEIDNNWEGFEWINADDKNRSIYSFFRKCEGDKKKLLFVLNMTPVRYQGFRVGVPNAGTYKLLLNSEEEKYGGFGYTKMPASIKAVQGDCDYKPYYLEFELPAYGGLVFEFQ